MSESTGEVAAGALTLAVAVGFFLYASQSTGWGGGAQSYPLTASFRSVQGADPGTDVRLAGVRVGSVSAIDLNPQTYRADMTVAIDSDVEIPDDSSIAVSSEGLLGGTFVEIVPGGSPFPLEPGMAFQDTQGALSLIGLLSQFVQSVGD